MSEADFDIASLSQLQELPKLKRLKLDRTYLTPSDVEALGANLPGVRIDFEPLEEDQRKKLEAYLK